MRAVFITTAIIGLFLLGTANGWLAHEQNFLMDRPEVGNVPEAVDALDEVNAARAAKHLSPYLRDEGLTTGAKKAASYRADHLCGGHTRDDFKFLPDGVTARCAGCAAWPESLGWGACETYSTKYRYAGAAWARGRDNKRYMHAFYR